MVSSLGPFLYKGLTLPSFHLSGKVELSMLWLQIYIKLSEINGAASLSNLAPMLSEPVALVISMFLRYFSTFSCEIHGIEKWVFAEIFLSQNSFSLSKLDAKGGSLIFDDTETKLTLY